MKNINKAKELLDKFFSSDSTIINSVLSKYEALSVEGPSVPEYFDLVDDEYNCLFDQFSDNIENESKFDSQAILYNSNEIKDSAQYEITFTQTMNIESTRIFVSATQKTTSYSAAA